jgi:hypothetical protein
MRILVVMSVGGAIADQTRGRRLPDREHDKAQNQHQGPHQPLQAALLATRDVTNL